MATFEAVESEVKDVEGIRVRVATPAALYRLKKIRFAQPTGKIPQRSAISLS